MSPLFIPSKKKSFSSTFTPLTLNPPHFLDIENQNHESLKSVERVILPLPVALVLLSYLSIFRCPAPGEKQKYQVTAFLNNYGATVLDYYLELFFYLPITNDCDSTDEATLAICFEPLKGHNLSIDLLLSSYILGA